MKVMFAHHVELVWSCRGSKQIDRFCKAMSHGEGGIMKNLLLVVLGSRFKKFWMDYRLGLLCSSLSPGSSLLGCRCLSVHKFLLLFCSVLGLPANIGSSRDNSRLSSWNCSISNYVVELISVEDMPYVLWESDVSDSVSDPIVSHDGLEFAVLPRGLACHCRVCLHFASLLWL